MKAPTRAISAYLFKYRWFILILVVLVAWFYWFQWRPTAIKRECSRVISVIPAISELTQAQIDREKQAFDACVTKHPSILSPASTGSQNNNPNSFLDKLEAANPPVAPECADMPRGYGKEAHPAEPEKNFYVPASTADYTFCLRSHGI